MSKYIELGKAIEAVNGAFKFEVEREENYRDIAVETLKLLPSVEVVRCKDCMFWRRDRISCEGYAMCKTGEGGIRFRRENDYCSVARRRTDER